MMLRPLGWVFADEIHAPLVYPEMRHSPYASTSDTAASHTLTGTCRILAVGWLRDRQTTIPQR